MQNKGVIRLFAIIFALACLYQLSFTYVSSQVESEAEEYANGEQDRKQAYLDSIGNQVVYDVLVDEFTYNEVKEREINLGLDLRGGMNVILEVSVKDILRELSNNSSHPLFTQALQRADAAARENQEDYLENFFIAFDELREQDGANIRLSDPRIFGTKEMNDKLQFNADDEQLKDQLRRDVDAAVENVYTVLRARIDQFGVVQPNIQRLDNSGRILVELPGVKDPDRVKKLLQSTAELEFWNLYDGREMLGFLDAANTRLRDIVEDPNADNTDTATQSNQTEDALDIQAVEEDPQQSDETAATDTTVEEDAEDDEMNIDSLLADDSDTAAADTASMFNPLFEKLYPNITSDNQPGAGPIVGFSLPQDTAAVNEYMKHPKVRGLLSGNARFTKFFWSAKTDENGYLYLFAARTDRNQEPELTGDVITNSRQDFDQSNRAVVSMTMNAQGAKKWAQITKEAAGLPSDDMDNKAVAVVLDGFVYSFPRVDGEIPTGNTQISGNFTVTEAQDLANILQAGALPAPARIIQSDIVGPSLGQEAITTGLWSFAVALTLVMIYMVFYYSGAGLTSDLALIVNMFFIFGVLASLGAVLTLPGIAGIVLTIGMAVDANVLIYERIREELIQGKGLRLAIRDGYNNAYSSIIDANVTTFLTGVILYMFGTGPIRGFATTLIIGILTSLFCAIFITRLVFEGRLARKKTVAFSTRLTHGAFSKVNINFLGRRKIAYIISGIILLAGIVSLSIRGLNYGVDFVGGRTYQVRFDQQINSADLQRSLGDQFINEAGNRVVPEVKTIGGGDQVIVTTKYRVDEAGDEVEQDLSQKLYLGSQAFFANPPTKENFFVDGSDAAEDGESIGVVAQRQVGPTIADDIKTSAFWAILFSLIIIFLYILIRFSKWQFSLGAVAAAFHDVLIVLSIFSLLYGLLPFSLEIDQAFIAAILTVIGYSLNDTVVVFDRIREFIKLKSKKSKMTSVANSALNSTLSRTINTSLTTFFVLLIIFIFGGESIKGFMFAMLIGIVVGTYSSIFIATPLMLDTLKKTDREDQE